MTDGPERIWVRPEKADVPPEWKSGWWQGRASGSYTDQYISFEQHQALLEALTADNERLQARVAELELNGSVAAAVKVIERYILQTANDATHSTDFEWFALHLSAFSFGDLTKDIAGAFCRSLRNRGLMYFEVGLFSDDGMPAGAGYRISEKGRAALKETSHD